jgi:uncharacterized protein YyaL (SSP411 family)
MEQSATHRYTNHLVNESSPYLLSHAHNPVKWYPWSDEAIARAKAEDKPIFLSIGYAACHWCHVMERESFENETIASILNEQFICIKVDREQRPDIDHIYMTFTQAMTGHGGWPMSVFLTPELRPFFAGTYFPPDNQGGRPGFAHIVTELAGAYAETKSQVVESADAIFDEIYRHVNMTGDTTRINDGMLTAAVTFLMKNYDHAHGGIGAAPKFPHSMEMSLFLRYGRRSGDLTFMLAAEKALSAMARGGIYDQIGGGFARYSTDPHWLVPHFEKMLYDNSLLVTTYAEAYQISDDQLYLETVRGTLDFMLRELISPEGGFYSALDADSEGVEGKFYIWTVAELKEILGEDAETVIAYYNATVIGNFEGENILHLTLQSDRLGVSVGEEKLAGIIARAKVKLLEARSKRTRPLTDDKILTSWNGLALSALCRGYQVTGDRRYLDAAIANAEFVQRELYKNDRLTHAYRKSVHSSGEFLEDYAYYTRGLIDLYESDNAGSNDRWLQFALTLAGKAEQFMDADGIFYLRPDNQPDLIFRPKEETDGSMPAPGSVMLLNLLKLHRLTERREFLVLAERGLRAISGQLARYPSGMTSALFAVDYLLAQKVEIVIVGEGESRDQMLAEVYKKYLPNRVIAFGKSGSNGPLFEGRESTDSATRGYVCIDSVCSLPALKVEDFKERLGEI